MQSRFCYLAVILLLLLAGCHDGPQISTEEYIDPTIGNISTLLQPTRPTMQLPNQMIRVYPLRKDATDDQINGFPLQIVAHNNGPVFILKPVTGALTPAAWQRPQTYDQEVIHPWYYRTYLLEDNVTVAFAPGSKTGIYRFTFPSTGPRHLLLDTAAYRVKDKSIRAQTFYHGDVPVYLYGEFNTPVNVVTLTDTLKYLAFPDTAFNNITLKYAISYVSMASAENSFKREIGKKDFTMVQKEGRARWKSVTDQISVEGGSHAQRRAFYTALYRCHERMVDITEDTLYYSGYNKKVNVTHRPFYVDDATWDTYQVLHPLRMILDPQQEADMLNAYTEMYRQSGWMPTFPRIYGDHPCMNGFHSTILFLDALRKGIPVADLETAYAGMKKNALSATMLPWRNGPNGVLDSFYYTHGYYPALAPGDTETIAAVHPFEKRQAVAVTLGHSYDDWVLSQLATALKKEDDARLFAARGENYRHLWHAGRGFFMPKDAAGNWININPATDGGPGGRDYYDENNGWTYLWQVQQNIPALISLMGGEKQLEARLDELFRTDPGMPRYELWHQFPDATGLVGQFSMGNEPGFHIPWLYNYAGAAWKTQKRVRFLLDLWFKDNVFGIPGDEDGGGMSAFVVFASMGFYPVTPGIPIYTIGSPVFPKITIALPESRQFTILAPNSSAVNKYIQSARLNGETLTSPFFTHQQLMKGGTLELEMGPTPNYRWGASVHAL
ncbi:GH92 family glycosyl hydrolase [Chitinophaga arvensicola]|uniref:Alpha-1,2-mannosidase, putative n=1 Tax=Chitinophaga arvensicola TaxID=29529 RepID=A0A1I0SBP7_9BACT|nr:GH92 family glycosyl hydrolase [Chitinophaga arvensicola]SEW54093.1 alpha-1,2-mannosidase, putative [Chitinophaga arvensicola]